MKSSLIQDAPLFFYLTEAEQHAISERLHLVQYTRDQHIFEPGDASAALYLIKTGWVRIAAPGIAILANLGAGSILGEGDLFLGRPRTTSAVAIANVELWTLAGSDLEALIAQNPQLGVHLSQGFGGHLVQMESYLSQRLAEVPGLDSLSTSQLAQVAGHLQAVQVDQGQALFTSGQKSTGLYVVEQGALQLGTADSFVELGPNDMAGQMALLADKPQVEEARAVQNTLLWFLPKHDFDALCSVIPELRTALSRHVRSTLSAADKTEALRRLAAMPLLAGVPDDVLRAVADCLLLQHVAKGEVVFKQGSAGEAMYLVDSGDVELSSALDSPDDVLARVGPGGFFGEMALLTGRPSAVNARTINDCNLWVLYRQDFETLMARHPALSMAISRALAARLADADERFVDRHLRRLPLFAGLTNQQLEDVSKYLRPERYRRGETIFVQNEPGSSLYLIETGRVALNSIEGGRAMELAVLHSGDFFGERSLLSGEPHSTSAVAQTDIDLWALDRADFESLIMRYPGLALNISRALSRRLYQTDARLVQARGTEAPVAGRPAAAGVAVAAVAATAAPAPRPPAVTRPPAAAAETAAPGGVLGAVWGLGQAVDNLAMWYRTRNRATKLRVWAIVLLFIWLCGIAVPVTLFSAISQQPTANSARRIVSMTQDTVQRSLGNIAPAAFAQGEALAMAQQAPQIPPTPTWTPPPTATSVPTDTPEPTATPTVTPPPTATPEPTATPTPLPPTRAPARVAAPAAVAPAAPAAAPAAKAPAAPAKPTTQYTIREMRRLTPCENKGMHNIFGTVVDAAGNPIDGITFIQTPANSIGEVLDRVTSGSKGPGRFEFVMWKGAEYAVYASADGASPTGSDVARPLHSNFTDEAECAPGEGGNTLFHNSFNVIFVKNW